jgi:putative nucleotidyltransferase with HDIG domain
MSKNAAGASGDTRQHQRVEDDLYLMAETQAKLASLEDLDEVYRLTGQTIYEMVGDAYVTISNLDEQLQAVKPIGYYGFGSLLDRISQQLGLDNDKSVYYLKDMTAEELRKFRSGKLEAIEEGLYAMLTHKVPRSVCAVAEKMLGITGVYTMGFVWRGLHFGGLTLLAKSDITPYQRMIEMVMSQAAISINRIRAEQTLKAHVNEITLLYEAGQQLSRTLDPVGLYDILFHLLSGAMTCDSLFVSSYEPQEALIRCAYAVVGGNSLDVSSFPPIPLEPEGKGTQSRVIRSGKPLLLKDYQAYHRTSQTQHYVTEEGALLEAQSVSEDADVPRSAIIAPIILEGQVVGVLQILSSKLNDYSEENLKVISMLASQIAVASNNALLYQRAQTEIAERKRAEEALARQAEELQGRNTELGRLYRTSASLVSSAPFDLPSLGQTIVDNVLQEFGKTNCSLIVTQPGSDDLLRLAIAGAYTEQVSNMKQTMAGQGLIPRAIRTGQVLNIPDVLCEPSYLVGWLAARSELTVPLKVRDHVIGAIDVQSAEPGNFTPDDERVLALYANQAAVALENTQLAAEARLQVDRLKALRMVDETINASLDLNLTSGVLLEVVTAKLGVDAADILLLDPHALTLEYFNGRGFRTSALQHTRLRIGQGLAGRAALERKMVHVSNFDQQKGVFDASPLLREEQFVEYFGVPLIAKGEVKGMLEIFHRSPLSPDETWFSFWNNLAGQAAIAIDNIEMFNNLQRSNSELTLAYDENIEGWSRTLDLRDEETQGHTQRVTDITMRLAAALDLKDEELVYIRWGALLHDIGKMGIPDRILLKLGALTEEEWAIMRKHPVYAYELLAPITFLKQSTDIPYCHHEKWDGSGYPQGLRGDQIPLPARIFAIADVWDALCSDRPYRPAWPVSQAAAYLRQQAGKQFEPRLVELFFNFYLAEENIITKPTILIVDDEEDIPRSLARSLRDQFAVFTANSGEEAVEMVGKVSPAVVLTDQRMPGMSGLELLDRIHQVKPKTVGLLMSAYMDMSDINHTVQLPYVSGFIPKPWDIDQLRYKLDEAVKHYHTLVSGS